MKTKYLAPELKIVSAQLDEFCDITTSSAAGGFINENIKVDTDDLDENILTEN